MSLREPCCDSLPDRMRTPRLFGLPARREPSFVLASCLFVGLLSTAAVSEILAVFRNFLPPKRKLLSVLQFGKGSEACIHDRRNSCKQSKTGSAPKIEHDRILTGLFPGCRARIPPRSSRCKGARVHDSLLSSGSCACSGLRWLWRVHERNVATSPFRIVSAGAGEDERWRPDVEVEVAVGEAVRRAISA